MPKIFFKGVVYDRAEDMPADIRAAYEEKVRILPDRDSNGIPDLFESQEPADAPPAAEAPASANQPSKTELKVAQESMKIFRWIPWIIGGVMATILACTALIFFVIFSSMKSSQAYVRGIQAARSSATVQEVLGTPLQEGFFVSGSVSDSGATGSARLNIPLSGPRQSGTLTIVAFKQESTWRLDTLYLDAGGQTYQIH